MKRAITLEIIVYAFILLFMYTAMSKLFVYDVYVSDLKRSPLLVPYAGILSVVLPAAEIVLSVLLFLPKTRLGGLYGSLSMMVLFTGYVGVLLFTQSTLPCTCGGMIRELTWKQHFFFNIGFIGLAVWGIWLQRKQMKEGMQKIPDSNLAERV